MSCLPGKQLSKSQRSSAELQIEPDAKIMQSYFRSQASLKARQVMRTFPSQAQRVQQFLIDGFNDLSQTGQPATQGFGPTLSFAGLVWRGDQIHLILLTPPTPRPLSCKSFVSEIRSLGRQTCTRQAWPGSLSCGKQGRSQMLVVCACTPKAKTRNHALCGDAEQQMEAFIPADTITPADI